jgi:hypothetical protein
MRFETYNSRKKKKKKAEVLTTTLLVDFRCCFMEQLARVVGDRERERERERGTSLHALAAQTGSRTSVLFVWDTLFLGLLTTIEFTVDNQIRGQLRLF